MMITNSKKCHAWTWLVSLFLFVIMASILVGGMTGYIQYRKSTDPGLKFNLSVLKFFTKEYLQRRYLHLTVAPLPVNSSVRTFKLFTDEQSLEALDSDLPASGKVRFVNGHIKLEDPDMESDIQFRYRGGLPLHWLYKKKSFRVKLPPFTTYLGERQFNLVNPSSIHTVTDWISYDMARSLGILTPEYFPVRLFINNDTNGVHYFLSRIDESFLRKNRRMPGSIYSGDTRYTPNPFGADEDGISEELFRDNDGISKIWQDARLWDKDASRNAESALDRSDIEKFIQIINLKDPAQFMRSFNHYFQMDKFYNYWALDTLTGSYHHDLFHNHKMYFDPYKGKFEPIEWDLRFWSSQFKSKDLPVYPLLRQVKLNPVFEFERDAVTLKIMDKFSVATIHEKIDQASKVIRPELAADPLRQHPDARYGRFTINKEVPFSMREYDKSIDELKLNYQNRYKFLQSVFNHSEVFYNIKNSGDNGVLLTLAVSGNSPVEFNPFQLTDKSIKISRVYKNKRQVLKDGSMERLYPGRSIKQGNVLNRADNWSILAFGKEQIIPSPIHYRYFIEGENLHAIMKEQLTFSNSLTAAKITGELTDELPDDQLTNSIHPWEIDNYQDQEKEHVLSGDIEINEDVVFESNQAVRILPGTTFKIAPGKSLIFYSRVIAEGSRELPISFLRLNQDKPWGSIVVQGNAADGSRLKYIHVIGGSITRQRLISYPGQINIHDLNHFELADCYISDNTIGDDSLHIAYSKGIVDNCHFESTAFDALDMDISEVQVTNSTFKSIGNDALDLMTSSITINNVHIDETGDKCVSIGEESNVEVSNSYFKRCFIGVAVKDQSRARLDRVAFDSITDQAISLYQKNPRYGSGGFIDNGAIYGISEQQIDAQGNSTIESISSSYLPLSDWNKN